MRYRPSLSLAAGVLAACATAPQGSPGGSGETAGLPAQARLVAVPIGFTGPEAVRYDPEQDVYFVSNFGSGGSSDADNNGFISRMLPDGTVQQLAFIAGGAGGATLHAPRGMTIVGDTLWVADADAVRGFDRRTGAPLATARFGEFDVGFLNDVAPGPDGVYVTDTGKDRIYRIANGVVTIALADTALGRPNGITWDRGSGRFIVVPYGGATVIRAWRPGSRMVTEIGRSTGAMFDGVEVLADGRILVASQADSSLHLFTQGRGRPILRTAGRPADIGVDTKRNQVAIPFIALNRVEIWQLPPQ